MVSTGSFAQLTAETRKLRQSTPAEFADEEIQAAAKRAAAQPERVVVGTGGTDELLDDSGIPGHMPHKLKSYWTHGPGAAKIAWGTGGDFERCRANLSRYVGPEQIDGLCANLHKDATKEWPGRGRHHSVDGIVADAGAVEVTEIPIEGEQKGARFVIPVLLPEGIETGDGRRFERGALSRRELPIPLLWQLETGEAHDGSYLVGRIDSLERTPEGIGNAIGVFDTGPWGREAERLVRDGMLRGVSADLDKFEGTVTKPELAEDELPDDGKILPEKMNITKARVMAVTLVAKPAFQESQIQLLDEDESMPKTVTDGTYQVQRAITAAAVALCAAIPLHPPKNWFSNPNLDKPSALTVTNDGRVFGHIAAWDVDHIGMPFGTRVPSSRSKYAYFHTGVVRTNEGDDVNVGQLTLSGGHAPLSADAAAAIKHYDDTKSAIADVHAGEDAFGVWVAGALRPDVTPAQVRMFRASAPSGDWRQIRGALELVAVCQVNVPGFPVARAQVASGALQALVAAGARPLLRERRVATVATAPDQALEERIQRLELAEQRRDAERLQAARERVDPLLAARREAQAAKLAAIKGRIDPLILANKEQEAQALAAQVAAQRERLTAAGVDDYLTAFKDFSPERRKKLAQKKHAMKDGSFPIENEADLKRAIRAYGRTTKEKQPAVRRHIIRRARGLGKPALIPEGWKEASLESVVLSIMDIRDAP